MPDRQTHRLSAHLATSCVVNALVILPVPRNARSAAFKSFLQSPAEPRDPRLMHLAHQMPESPLPSKKYRRWRGQLPDWVERQ